MPNYLFSSEIILTHIPGCASTWDPPPENWDLCPFVLILTKLHLLFSFIWFYLDNYPRQADHISKRRDSSFSNAARANPWLYFSYDCPRGSW